MAQHADLAIVGGGCAGLALARDLSRAEYQGRVVLLEPRPAYADDRSWCFWEQPVHGLSHLVSQRWSAWECSTASGQAVTKKSHNRWYQYVRSLDYYRDAVAAIDSNPRCERLRTSLDFFEPLTSGGFRLRTPQGDLEVGQLVDTRPPVFKRLSGVPMFQSFVGREIELPEGRVSRPDVATLMGNLRTEGRDILFDYILPINNTRVLVESTRLSAAPVGIVKLEADLAGLLAARHWQDGRVLRQEHGVLPMGLPEESGSEIPGFARAGTGGGGLRAASGYGFLRIQRWARHCADALLGGGSVLAHPREPGWRRWMDSVFLNVLLDQPSLGPEVFFRLFAGHNPDRLVRFLSDQAGPVDVFSIMANLPFTPFSRQAVRLIRERRPAWA